MLGNAFPCVTLTKHSTDVQKIAEGDLPRKQRLYSLKALSLKKAREHVMITN